MTAINTLDSSAPTIEISVRLNPRRAQKLWFAAYCAATLDFEDRFEDADGDGALYVHDDDAWPAGTVMWCERALEAFTLSEYEARCGFRTRVLWNLDYGPNGSGSYAVLSSRPFDYPRQRVAS